MDIVIIGSGNVAAVLGRKFKAAGHNILQVYSRNSSTASKLAYEWDTESTNYKSLINKEAAIYIIAVDDNSIKEVVKELYLPGKVVAHTAATISKEILKDVSSHYGVFYPLQSLKKELTSLPDIPVFLEGSDDLTTKTLTALADSITEYKITEAGSDERSKMHLAAVVVNNFPNHLYTLAEEYCLKEGLDFKQLIPLIEETTKRLKEIPARQAQTGPAIRHDSETIHKHMELLKNYPQLKNIYLLITESIQQLI